MPPSTSSAPSTSPHSATSAAWPAQLPSTVIGCLVHGAEHAMRHVGQLSVTARVAARQPRTEHGAHGTA
jgi:hypothetical protein